MAMNVKRPKCGSTRNTISGFGQRVVKNLNFIVQAGTSEDVHKVTALVTSLLGLIVFPCEQIKMRGSTFFKEYKLNDLAREGWPEWTFEIGASDDVNDLVQHVRNAISHRRVCFSSDNRQLENVTIRFRDRPRKDADDTWGASINASDLMKFVLRFAGLLKQWNGES